MKKIGKITLNKMPMEVIINGLTNIDMVLGESFFKYKQNVNTLREAVERHFAKVIQDIENGLPEVKDEETKEDEYSMLLKEDWTCPTC